MSTETPLRPEDEPGFAERLGAALLARGVPPEYLPAAGAVLRDFLADRDRHAEMIWRRERREAEEGAP